MSVYSPKRSTAQAIKWLLVVAAGATHAFLEPGWLSIATALVAFIALAADRRFGIFGAAALLLVALPYDRAANSELLRVGGVPVRPHDVVAGAAILLALPRIRGRQLTWVSASLVAFLVLGGFAFVLGFVNENATRDILRDARWWFLYIVGLLALGIRERPSAVLRGIIVGATAFALLAVITTLMPVVEGGLKERALIYDRGTLRMQFGNSIFLVFALGYTTWTWLESRTRSRGVLVVLLMSAIALSLTRMLVLVSLGSLALTCVWWLWASRQRSPAPRRLPRLAAVAGMALIGVVLGIVLNTSHPLLEEAIAGLQPEAGPVAPGETPENPFDRFFFQGERAGPEAIASGRLSSYARAFLDMTRSPVLGTGMGTLVDIGYTFGGEAFDTPGKLPNVDNAYLTMGLKAGAVGIAVFGLMLLSPFVAWRRRGIPKLWAWLPAAWVGVLALTMTQSFAVIGYTPFVLSLLLTLSTTPRYATSRRAAATSGE